ncbi:protein-L-isoaspartate O-methyltransferase [Campylobacterota bacterium]|nr:protein-L-isoaspartate O-methyltransferase [Campylobacterota bacterium]
MPPRNQSVFAQSLAEEVHLSDRVKAAFASVDRAPFMPTGLERQAYELRAMPLGSNQWISSPLTVAKMTMALECENADSVLEIGCGSGYQAAILSKIVRRVFTIERIEKLLVEAKARFKALGLTQINTRLADGGGGWTNYAPYDRILLSCEAASLPQTLIDQLVVGGILVAPIGGTITRAKKLPDHTIATTTLGQAAFVPLLNGVEKQ